MDAEIPILRAEVERLTAENERLHFDYERLAERKPLDEVDAWRALTDDVFTWIEASQPGGTKAQLNAQFQALDDLIKRYRELRDRV